MSTLRVVCYLNQFFGGLGGEYHADAAPSSRAGAVGPGVALQRTLGTQATIVGTIIAGDGRFADRPDERAISKTASSAEADSINGSIRMPPRERSSSSSNPRRVSSIERTSSALSIFG